MFLGDPLGGLASNQAFHLDGFDQVAAHVTRREFLGSEESSTLHGSLLKEDHFLDVPLVHFFELGQTLAMPDSRHFLIPGHGPGSPIPALGPATDGTRGPRFTAGGCIVGCRM